MIKRSLCYLCVVSLLAGLLIIPVNASTVRSETNDSGTAYVNYLTALSYNFGGDAVTSDVPVYKPYSAKHIHNLAFVPLNFSTSDYLMFCVIATALPDRVDVQFDPNEPYFNPIFEGRIYGSNGLNYYFYRLDMPTVVTYLSFDFVYNTPYGDEIGLYSCFGVRNLLATYDRAAFNVVTKSDGPEGVFFEKRTNIGTKMFPYTYRNDTTDDLNSADFSIWLDSDRFVTTAVDQVNLLITSYAEKITVTASLVPKDASVQEVSNIKVNLSVDKEWGLVNNYESGLGTVYNYSAFQASVDLHGYDLTKYELFFYVSVDPVLYVNASSISNTRLLEVTFRSISYVPTVVSEAWYTPIIRAINPIRTILKDINIQSEALLNDLKGYFSEFFGKWDNRWDSLMLKLEEYFGEDGELAEKGDAMQNQADQMQQANDAMNSVEKPAVDAGAMLDQYLNFNPAGLAILSVITGNPFATSMLVVIFTFALCGYIFFGKKR